MWKKNNLSTENEEKNKKARPFKVASIKKKCLTLNLVFNIIDKCSR